MNRFLLVIAILLPLIAVCCTGSASPVANVAANSNSPAKSVNQTQNKDNQRDANLSTAESDLCNKALWERVYKPDRLEIKDPCKVVTGTITERNADDDGDEHMLLKLDAGQDDLLTKKNEKKKDGDLVIEAVCVNPTKLKKVGDTCNGFTNPVFLPQVGEHVRVIGSYVIDTNNGWAEIHPITTVEKLQ